MFDKLSHRATHLGEARAAARRERLAARLQELAPADVEVLQEGEAVVLRGRRGRFAGDPELRWLVAEARDG